MNYRQPNPYFISRNHLESIRSRSQSVSAAVGGSKIRNNALEDRYRNYLRESSQQMTRNWTNSVQSLSRQHREDRENLQRQRTEDDQKAYEAMREQQRRNQRAQIEEIETKMRRTQAGPQLLDSAALLSNCLHVQRAQREEMALRNISNRQQIFQEGRLLRLQNQQWTLAQQQRMQENHLRAMRYKQDLRGMIDERTMQRDMQLFHLQCPTPPTVCGDFLFQRNLDKERREMERRRIQLRQTATDAMRMAEQRRLREKVTNGVQEKLSAIYLEGRSRQEEMIRDQAAAVQKEHEERVEAGRDKISKILTDEATKEKKQEEVILSNASEEYTQQLLARERAEVERKRKLKAQRIQIHLEEQEAARLKKQEEDRKAKEAVIRRLENELVTKNFVKDEREKRIKEAIELRRKLDSQWEERQATEKALKESVQSFTNRQCDYSQDHKDFIKYAKEAFEVAKEKQLPLQPLVKAIGKYEKDNFVEEKPLLPHLEVRKPPVEYERPPLPKGNSKEIIRYNIEQLRALNPVERG